MDEKTVSSADQPIIAERDKCQGTSLLVP